MAERIDELQLQIGSDASDAIRQLGNLATALDIAARAASNLGSASGNLTSFISGIEKFANTDLSGAIDNLKKLSRINLNNLKDKKVNVDISVSGADRIDRLRYAASQAERDIGRSVTSMSKALGKDLGMNTSGIKEVNTILHDMAHDMAGGGNAAAGFEKLKEAISDSARVSTADLTGMRKEYEAFLKDVENLRINPGQISKDEMAEWKKLGLQRILKTGGQRIDTDVFGFDSGFLAEHSNIIDAFSVPMDAPDQFVFLREKILEAQEALNGFVQTDTVTEKIDQIAQSYREKIQGMMDVATSKRMTDSADKIPIDLDIDQNRFEAQIQRAINEATGKTYDTKPIKLNIDSQQLKRNVEAAFSLVDLPRLPQFAAGFSQVADAISTMNQTNLKSTGIIQFANAFRRLIEVDSSTFDPSLLHKVADGISKFTNIGEISSGVTKFVSAIARLASAGSDTRKTAYGLDALVPRLRSAVKSFVEMGAIDSSINQFVSAFAKLATSGSKAGEAAKNIKELTKEVLGFLEALKNAPEINSNVAMTIQGLGNIAAAGGKVGKELDRASTSSNKLARSIVNITVDTLVSSLKKLLNIALKLGGQGVAAIGSFLSKLHLIPSFSASADRSALSFGNLLRSVLPFVGIKGVFDWAKGAFEAGSSIVELQNVIDTAFGSVINGYKDISGYIYNWSKDTIDAFGVSEIAAQRYAGRLMSMFNSSGFDANEKMRDSAAKMTTDLIQRAGDIASFYDINVDEAMTKMQAALAGMTRPMRALGVNMNVANLEAYAMSKGINQSWQEMDQATQMAVRYQYMLNATRYAEGDFGRTSMSAANQVRLLQLNTQMLSATMGQGLVSAIGPVISWLNALIKRLIQAAVAFRTFMWTLFGKPLAAARGLLDETAGYLDDATGAASDLGNAGGGAADGLESAGKAAKELKKQLTVLPFDELNQLAKDTESAGSGGGGGGGGGGGVGGLGDMSGLGLLPDFSAEIENSPVADAVNKWALKIRQAFMDHDWPLLGKNIAGALNEGFAYVYKLLDWDNWEDKVYGFIQPFQVTMNSMMHYVDFELIGATLARGLNLITKTFRIWVNGFAWESYGRKFAEGMNGFLYEWDAEEFGRAIADKFKMAWDFFGGWVKKFDFKLLGTRLKEGVIGALDELKWTEMGESLAGLFNGISDTIISFFEGEDPINKLAESFAGFVNGFLEKFDAEKAKEALNTVKESIKKGLSTAIKKINKKELADDIKTLLSELPWGWIATVLGLKVGGKLALGIFGEAFKKAATKRLSDVISQKLGWGTAGKAGASGAGASAAGGGASAGTGIGVGGALAGAGGIGAALGFGLWMRHMAEKNGGIQQFDGKNLAPSTQTTVVESQNKNNQALANRGMNAAGQYTSIQGSVPQPSMPSKNVVTTTLKGVEDPSFTNLTRAKAALIEIPIIKKWLDGDTTKKFDSGYSKYTNTKPYNVNKQFAATEKGGFTDKYGKYVFTTKKDVSKNFAGKETGGFVDKYGKYVFTTKKDVTKNYAGKESGGFLDKYGKYVYTTKKDVSKNYAGSESGGFSSKLSDYKYTKNRDVTKTFIGRDGGNFMSYFNKFAYSLYDKTVRVTFDIITTAKNVVASIVGKGREILASIWTENARGGLFTGPVGFQVFGEAGAEAAIPLERKSTMKRIGSAIANAGGMASSNSDDIADAVAERLAPIIMSAINGQSSRPINVNATLYTENNEVLARAVNQGNRTLDKRYNPVSQYGY